MRTQSLGCLAAYNLLLFEERDDNAGDMNLMPIHTIRQYSSDPRTLPG